MYKLLTKNGQVFAFGLGIFLTAIFLISVLSGLEDFNLLSDDDQKTTNIFNFGLYAVVTLTIICAILAIGFGLFQLASNPKGSMVGVIGVVALLAVFFISYSMSEVETSGPVFKAMEKFDISDGESKFIGASITTLLLMGALAIAAFVISELRNFFK